MRNEDLKKKEIAELITAINVKDCMLSDLSMILSDLKEKITKTEFENTKNDTEIQKLSKKIESFEEENNYLLEKLDKKTMKEKQLKSKINELDTLNFRLKEELDIDQDTDSDSDSKSGSESDPGSDSDSDFNRDSNGNKVCHLHNNYNNNNNNTNNTNNNNNHNNNNNTNNNNNNNNDNHNNNNNNSNNNNNNNNNDNDNDSNINDNYHNNKIKIKINQKEKKMFQNIKINSKISSEVPASRGIAETEEYEIADTEYDNHNKRIKSKNSVKNKAAADNREYLIESDTNNEKINEKEERKKLQFLPRKELKNIIRKLEKEKKSNEKKIIFLSELNNNKKTIEIVEKNNMSLIEKLKFDFSILLEEGKEVKKQKDLADKELLKKEKEGLRIAQTMVRYEKMKMKMIIYRVTIFGKFIFVMIIIIIVSIINYCILVVSLF